MTIPLIVEWNTVNHSDSGNGEPGFGHPSVRVHVIAYTCVSVEAVQGINRTYTVALKRVPLC